MIGARFKWCTGPAVLAAVAALSFGGAAQAADLGGDCCADLEERIAELEATTVRKGNRKVSLTVTGWVSSAVMFWDDGEEANAYVVQDSTDLASNVTFTGSAQINSDWSAGYLINIFFDDTNSLLVNQANDDVGPGVNVQRSFWYLQSKSYGKVSVGLQSSAADNAAILTDFTGTLFHANSVTFDGAFFNLRPEGGTGSLVAGTFQTLLFCNSQGVGIANDCNGSRTNSVRYDTPTFGGFSASGSWGEDDVWETSLRYAGEGGGFKYSAAVGYGWTNGDNAGGSFFDVNGAPVDTEYFQAGLTIKHLPSALWVHATYGNEETDNDVVSDGQGWFIKAGISPKLNSLGTTHFYGSYGGNSDTYGFYGFASAPVQATACNQLGTAGGNIGAACAADAATAITGSDVLRLGAGVVQEIDAASMNLYVKWVHLDAEVDFIDTAGVAGSQEFDDLNIIMVGAHIFF